MKRKIARNGNNNARELKRAVVTMERNKEEVTHYGKTIARLLRRRKGDDGGMEGTVCASDRGGGERDI